MLIRAPVRLPVLVVTVTLAAGLAGAGSHAVQHGDAPPGLAADHVASVRAVAEANGTVDPDLVLAGSTQRITARAGGAEAGTSPHVVRAGETLSAIALRYGTTVSELASLNRISNPDLIIIGRTLTVPGGSTGPDAPPAPPGGSTERPGERHTVSPGETLGSIAARYGISSTDLAAWNGIVDGRIYATTRLLLWNPGSLPSAGSSGGGTHLVARGESLSGIARRYGTTVARLASANGIADPDRITAGQRLRVGGGGSVRCIVPGATFFNDWAFPRSGGRAHAGNDLFAPRGTPILAPVDGTASHSTGELGGHQVRLVDERGALWFASHMDAFGKSGRVSAGDVIGRVGDSGNARGSRPHAHVEYHGPEGNAVNPYPLLRQIC